MAPRRCPVCRSKQWHKEPSSGLVACSEGHVLQNYRNEVMDTGDDLGQWMMHKRTLKSGRKKKEKRSKADPKLYHGSRARYLYFQCQQLILRQQILGLTTLWKLPKEFEVVCRDIWSLHLTLLPSPPPAEPYFHAQDVGGAQKGSDATRKLQEGLKTPRDSGDEEDDNNNDNNEDRSSSSSENGSDDEEDHELAALLRENSESSSSSEEVEGNKRDVPPKRKPKKSRAQEVLASTVAVLMLACWTLRIPVIYMDFIRAIESYELPYLDPVRFLPQEMVAHLAPSTKKALSPQHSPTTSFLHALTSRLAKLIYSSFGVFTPEFNAAPVLWRAVRCLEGTPMLYDMTKRLARVLSLPLTLHHSLSPGLKQIRKRDPERHKFDHVPPELALISTAIIVLKMVYGLDDKPRLPTGPNDPASALPNLEEYLSVLRVTDEIEMNAKNEIFSSSRPTPVGELTGEMLDEYLEFCQKALLAPVGERHLLDNHFPLIKDGAGNRSTEGTSSTHRALPAMMMKEGEDALNPGHSYTIYSSRDVSGSLPDKHELISGRAARWVGVSDDHLCAVVERFERRLMSWWENRKRLQKDRERRNVDMDDEEEGSARDGDA